MIPDRRLLTCFAAEVMGRGILQQGISPAVIAGLTHLLGAWCAGHMLTLPCCLPGRHVGDREPGRITATAGKLLLQLLVVLVQVWLAGSWRSTLLGLSCFAHG